MIGTAPAARMASMSAAAALVAGDGRGLGDVEDVELVVRDAAAGVDGQLGGADVHPAVELHRVGVDDLGAEWPEPFGDVQRQLGLAGAGGADDRQWPHGRRHSCQAPAK